MRVYGEEVADRKANYDLIWFKHIILITKTCNKGVPKVTFHHLPKSWFFKYVVFGVWKTKTRAGICFVQAENKPNRSRRLEADIYLDDSLVPLKEGEEFNVL